MSRAACADRAAVKLFRREEGFAVPGPDSLLGNACVAEFATAAAADTETVEDVAMGVERARLDERAPTVLSASFCVDPSRVLEEIMISRGRASTAKCFSCNALHPPSLGRLAPFAQYALDGTVRALPAALTGPTLPPKQQWLPYLGDASYSVDQVHDDDAGDGDGGGRRDVEIR